MLVGVAYGPLEGAFSGVSNPLVRAGLREGTLNAIGSAGASAGFALNRAITNRLEDDANPFQDILEAATFGFVASFGVRYVSGVGTAGRILAIKSGSLWTVRFISGSVEPVMEGEGE